MHVEHHTLSHEFPNLQQAIGELRASNQEFAGLLDEYEKLTAEVERLEEADLPVDDLTIEEMKKRRVRLKDELYNLLVAAKK